MKKKYHDSNLFSKNGALDTPERESGEGGLVRASKAHLDEANMAYWPHLTHAFHQSNRLIVVAIKSYVHGVFPLWFKADGPKTIIRMYHEIRRIHHIDRFSARDGKGDGRRDGKINSTPV